MVVHEKLGWVFEEPTDNDLGGIMRIVEVTWDDAWLEIDHITLEYAKTLRPLQRKNVGYLLDETDDYVIIVSGTIANYSKGETACDGTLVIPKRMVNSVTSVKEYA